MEDRKFIEISQVSFDSEPNPITGAGLMVMGKVCSDKEMEKDCSEFTITEKETEVSEGRELSDSEDNEAWRSGFRKLIKLVGKYPEESPPLEGIIQIKDKCLCLKEK